jgi:hypothetical protein
MSLQKMRQMLKKLHFVFHTKWMDGRMKHFMIYYLNQSQF